MENMKRTMIIAVLAALSQVVFTTNMHCVKCAEKIQDKLAFEKGINDLEFDVSRKTVKVTFDPAKTDTARIGGALRKLGYAARGGEIVVVKN